MKSNLELKKKKRETIEFEMYYTCGDKRVRNLAITIDNKDSRWVKAEEEGWAMLRFALLEPWGTRMLMLRRLLINVKLPT